MSAGTIKLTNGSTAVVGTSTTFTTDLKSGDVITTTIGGVFYTLFVDTVSSNTALTLSDAFTGPTTTGAAYVAVPQMTLNRITAALAAQTAEAVRRVLQENANWQAFYSGTGDITVTLPNGTPTGVQVSGPSWAKLSGVANTAWIDRGQLATDANLNTMNPATTEGEWSKSSSTGLTTANGFPVGAGVGTLKVNNGGRYQGQHVYTDYLGNQWVRTLTSTWNGVDGPWSDWVNTATKSLRSTSVVGNATDLNTYNGPDYFGTYRMTKGTVALNYPYENFYGTVEVVQGYPGTAQQIATSNLGNVFVRQCSSTYVWSTWLEVGRQPRNTAFIGNADTLFDPGDYPTTSATTGLPMPSGLTTQPGGMLRVYICSSGVYHQDFIVYGSNQTHSNRRFTRTYFNSWTPWREVYDENSLPLLLGIGSITNVTTQSVFDFQTFIPASGAVYLVSSSNITNMPAGISFTAGTGIFIKVDGISTSGTRIQYSIIPDTTVNSNFKLFKVLSVGAPSSRAFTVRQQFTDTDIVPLASGGTGNANGIANNVSGTVALANGGTGSTTAAGARTNLGLKGAAILDVGTAASTVAAGNDARLGTLDAKSGGQVTSSINLTGTASAFIGHKSGVGTENGNTYRRMVYGYLNDVQYSWMDAYVTSANVLTRIITVNNSTFRTFNFYDTGSATCDGTWQNGSDERHKYNIKCVPDALAAVLTWRGATYTKKDGGDEVGLIAQDVEKACPEAIFDAGRREFSDGTVIEDFKTLNTAGAAAAYHTEAIKELHAMFVDLRDEFARYKAETDKTIQAMQQQLAGV